MQPVRSLKPALLVLAVGVSEIAVFPNQPLLLVSLAIVVAHPAKALKSPLSISEVGTKARSGEVLPVCWP